MKPIVLVALAGVLSIALAVSLAARPQTSAGPGRVSVVIFHEAGFPAVDTVSPDVAALRAALAEYDVQIADTAQLPGALVPGRVLVLPFGSAFPRDAWPAIFAFLAKGGHLVNLGGVPFAVPVSRRDESESGIGDRESTDAVTKGREAGGEWRVAPRTTTYHKELGIVQAFPVEAADLTFTPARADAASASLAADARAAHVYELIVRFTSTKSFPQEDGSDGPREARLTALVHGYAPRRASSAETPPSTVPTSDSGPRTSDVRPHVPVVAPFVQIDRLSGSFAGGRWVLATGDSGVTARSVATLVARAAAGPTDLRLQPRYAGFHPGEPLVVTVSLSRPGAADDTDSTATGGARTGDAESGRTVPVTIHLLDEANHIVSTVSAEMRAGKTAGVEVTLPLDSKTLPPGLYHVTAVVNAMGATSGLWIYDAAMLGGGKPLTAGRDYFVRDGAPIPVTGTTYMATDVHRRFLLEPNPWLWDHDFAAMAEAGVNLVRTGIWTAWQLHSEADGRPTEAMLRALDVFLLTARRHDIPVIFNLFAFTPYTWGGVNPYFDRRAIDAQKRFVGGIASRLAGANDIAWDLINEPSFSSPSRLWSTRPNYDADEKAAWQAWLRETVPAPDDATREARLLERWNALPDEGTGLPAMQDFGDKNLFGAARPNKAADYKRFAQAAFTIWVREMRQAISAGGSPMQLVTVGQDEGGQGERPNPLLFGGAVDFTGTHSWWNNDALLWDALLSKRQDKPSLIEETGLMTYERPDGTPWRTEVEARNLLERKLALAFAGGGAGFVQWLWNSNVYMPLDNEAGIGFLREDGTAKPELEAFTRIAGFVRQHRAHFAGRVPEEVVLVVPQSEIYSARDFGTAATQHAVRTLEYELHVPVRAVSEYATDDLRKGGRLMLLPAPRVLTDAAWHALLEAATNGAVLLVTGPIDRDEYEQPVGRLAALGLDVVTRPVAPENLLRTDGVQVGVPFRGSKLERLERGVVQEAAGASMVVLTRGKGKIVWCPLPVELADDDRATVAVYRMALRLATVRGTECDVRGTGVLVRPLAFADSVLYVLVNESDTDATVTVRVPGAKQPLNATVTAERAKLVLVDRASGRVIGTT